MRYQYVDIRGRKLLEIVSRQGYGSVLQKWKEPIKPGSTEMLTVYRVKNYEPFQSWIMTNCQFDATSGNESIIIKDMRNRAEWGLV